MTCDLSLAPWIIIHVVGACGCDTVLTLGIVASGVTSSSKKSLKWQYLEKKKKKRRSSTAW